MIWITLNGCSVYLFGVILMFTFLDMRRTARNIFLLTACSIPLLFIQFLTVYFWDLDMVNKVYPLIVHLPLYLLAVFYYGYSFTRTLAALLVAYLLTMSRSWLGAVPALLFPSLPFSQDQATFVITFPLLYLLYRFLAPFVQKAIKLPEKNLSIILLPVLCYYLVSYAITVYTNILYQLNAVTFDLIISIFSLLFFFLFAFYFSRLFHNANLEKTQQMMQILSNAFSQQLDDFKTSEKKIRTLRHDMRHHFQIIDHYASAGKNNEIKFYIRALQQEVEETIVQQYCSNEMVNLILSSFCTKAREQQITLTITANIPSVIPVSDVDICIILANGIENAIHAASLTNQKWITVTCSMYREKIIIQLKNPYLGDIRFQNGLPQSTIPGHGIGTFSITAVAEKYHGLCSFRAEDHIFILQVII